MFESVQLSKVSPGEAYTRLYKNGPVIEPDPHLQAMGLDKKRGTPAKTSHSSHFFKSVNRDKRE